MSDIALTAWRRTAAEIPVIVQVMNTQDEVVFRAQIRMWVSPRKASA